MSEEKRRSPYRAWYCPPDFEPTLSKFEEIAKREFGNDSRGATSKLIRKIIADYVRIHEPGNPQLKLTRFAEPGFTLEKPRKCRYYELDSNGIHWCHLRGVGSKYNPCEVCCLPPGER